MTMTDTIAKMDAQIAQYAPLVIVGVQAAEQSTASGATKKQAVLDAIVAGSHVAEAIPVPQVAAIGGLIDLVVSIFNSLHIFGHSTSTPAAPPAA
jgi:hypothetical protein